ncbi:unnamed protein product [Linum trigynum]|uniref:Uncharacterized protein n=1 Tax=Linum trigynum TaxID=586398 RepID=A0AAV2ESF9_9ROSI
MQLIRTSEYQRFFEANLQDWILGNIRHQQKSLDFGITLRNALDKDRFIHHPSPPARTEEQITWERPPPEWGSCSITQADLRGAVEGPSSFLWLSLFPISDSMLTYLLLYDCQGVSVPRLVLNEV